MSMAPEVQKAFEGGNMVSALESQAFEGVRSWPYGGSPAIMMEWVALQWSRMLVHSHFRTIQRAPHARKCSPGICPRSSRARRLHA